jgi:SAM-dependent methyltransferase
MLEFNRTIAAKETMKAPKEEAYFRVALSGYEAVRRALFSAGKAPESVREILDFGCGHGRVLRTLSAGFPDATVTACDLLEDGVDFCVKTFGARPLEAHEDLSLIAPPVKFDLIWVGSVFTHLPLERWRAFIEFFSQILATDGILVFTVHGRTSLWALENHTLDKSYLTREQFDEVKARFKGEGFAYVPYESKLIKAMANAGVEVSPGLYGLSYARPDWVCRLLTEYPRLALVSYTEAGWAGNHDTVAVVSPRAPRTI